MTFLHSHFIPIYNSIFEELFFPSFLCYVACLFEKLNNLWKFLSSLLNFHAHSLLIAFVDNLTMLIIFYNKIKWRCNLSKKMFTVIVHSWVKFAIKSYHEILWIICMRLRTFLCFSNITDMGFGGDLICGKQILW
jgi:hypothetical protein